MTQANVSFARHSWPQSTNPNSKEYLEKYAKIYDMSLGLPTLNRHASPRGGTALLRKYYKHLKQPGIIMPKENFMFNVRRLMSYTKIVRAGEDRPRLYFFPILKYQSFTVTDDKVGYEAKVEYPFTDHMHDEIWLGYNKHNVCEALWERIRPLGYVFFGGAQREIPYDKDGLEDLIGYWPMPVCGSFPAPLPMNAPHPYASHNESDNDDGESSLGSYSLISDPQHFLRPDFPRAALNDDVDLDNFWYDAFGNRHTGTGNAASSSEGHIRPE